MSQRTSPSVLKRESEGIGRLHMAGYGPEHWLIKTLPGDGLPSPRPWSNPTVEMEEECIPVAKVADGLCVRVKTVRDYLREAGLEPVPESETNRQLREAVEAKKAGELSDDEYNDLVEDILLAQADEGPYLVDCGALALWVFEHGKHRLRHRWAWWWVEWALGTWTPENGYITAPPMTRKEWRQVDSKW